MLRLPRSALIARLLVPTPASTFVVPPSLSHRGFLCLRPFATAASSASPPPLPAYSDDVDLYDGSSHLVTPPQPKQQRKRGPVSSSPHSGTGVAIPIPTATSTPAEPPVTGRRRLKKRPPSRYATSFEPSIHRPDPSSSSSSSSSPSDETEFDPHAHGLTAFSWFPGHMHKTMQRLTPKIKAAKVILELRDARIPFASHNPTLEAAIKDKKRIIIFNKADLCRPESIEQLRAYYESLSPPVPVLFCSSREPMSLQPLVPMIETMITRQWKTLPAPVLIVGYPNVGKSSLINALKNLTVTTSDHGNTQSLQDALTGGWAKVGPLPGVTRHISGFLVSEEPPIWIIDTPGIMLPKFEPGPAGLEVALKLALTGAVKDSVIGERVIASYLLSVLNRYRPRSYLSILYPFRYLPDVLSSLSPRAAAPSFLASQKRLLRHPAARRYTLRMAEQAQTAMAQRRADQADDETAGTGNELSLDEQQQQQLRRDVVHDVDRFLHLLAFRLERGLLRMPVKAERAAAQKQKLQHKREQRMLQFGGLSRKDYLKTKKKKADAKAAAAAAAKTEAEAEADTELALSDGAARIKAALAIPRLTMAQMLTKTERDMRLLPNYSPSPNQLLAAARWIITQYRTGELGQLTLDRIPIVDTPIEEPAEPLQAKPTRTRRAVRMRPAAAGV